MTKYLAKIGLEMHCEMSETNTKVFSAARNSYSESPNTNVRPLDMGFPGTLPVVNKEAVRLALMASMILNCQQPEYIYFERKNYYYPDMPKNFQITQETKPIPVGIYGKVSYECDGEIKEVRVNNIHLEEDAASLDHFYATSNIDYNRAGVPLLELVTEPDIHSAKEAVAFLEHMRSVYQYAGISEADSKKGQIRCDVNVSLMDASADEKDPKNWGVRAEIKNINSFGGVRDAINYEIERQTEILNNGGEVEQETRRWDEESGTTIRMRSKVDAIDYKYFVEPNIPKYKVTKEWLDEIKASIPELAMDRKKKYIEEYGLSPYDAGVLVKEKDISDYFEKCVALNIDVKQAANWVSVNVIGELNKENISIKDFYLIPEMLKQITDAINSGTLSSKQAKEVFFKAIEEKKEPKNYISKENAQISDRDELTKIICEILDNSSTQIEQYKGGRDNIFDYFVGQVMKNTRGKANPVITKEILHAELDKR
ncbi:MAG TPA: Asp-tRNA(Asn)/Glu-tRNA(Gln) amidotransferase subunit GatB [Candidatus Coprovivens excrementavium]|nr:Asp-tRNA(Asn)/Glu-tRNA(Gln) amidotransferase subunit GatB [Candidatus Coprovivens excrementavium]